MARCSEKDAQELAFGKEERLPSEQLQSLFNILMEVRKERLRQEDLKAAGKFAHTAADPQLTRHEKLAILTEEFAEALTEKFLLVTRSVNDSADSAKLRTELLQVATIAVAWVQGLDTEKSE